MKKYFLTLLFLSCSSIANNQHELSLEREININSIIEGPLSKDIAMASPLKDGDRTYTYIRCHYRVNSSADKLESEYAWAKSSMSSYYKLTGYWWSDSIVDWKNMYYTEKPYTELLDICQKTLEYEGIKRPVAMISAANTTLSINYTIWSNNQQSDSRKFNRMVTFGDSLSDTNNSFNASLWNFPNKNSWYMGHYTNGPVWSEYVSDRLQLPLYNWAVGGAGVEQQKLVIPGMLEQVNSWLEYMQKAKNYQPANFLFTMWIGGNDLINYKESVENMIDKQTKALKKLIDVGARKILVINLPDVTHSPTFNVRDDKQTVKQQVKEYNQKIKEVVNKLNSENGGELLKLYDSYEVFEDVINNKKKYNLDNVVDSCLDLDSPGIENYLKTFPLRKECRNPDTFVFWDMLHPTTNIHEILANKLLPILQTMIK